MIALITIISVATLAAVRWCHFGFPNQRIHWFGRLRYWRVSGLPLEQEHLRARDCWATRLALVSQHQAGGAQGKESSHQDRGHGEWARPLLLARSLQQCAERLPDSVRPPTQRWSQFSSR